MVSVTTTATSTPSAGAARRAAGRRWRPGRRAAGRARRPHVGAVDAGGGLHDAELVRDDQGPAAAGDHPLGLGVDQLAAQRVALLRVGRGAATSRPSTLETTLRGDHQDVAVGQPRRGRGDRARRGRRPGRNSGRPRHRAATADGRRARAWSPTCGRTGGQTPADSSAARAIVGGGVEVGHQQRHGAHLDARDVGGVAGVHQPAVEQAAVGARAVVPARPPPRVVSHADRGPGRRRPCRARAAADDRREPDHPGRRVAQRVAQRRARRGSRRC